MLVVKSDKWWHTEKCSPRLHRKHRRFGGTRTSQNSTECLVVFRVVYINSYLQGEERKSENIN
ncbi:MAG: hypothetical protein DRJ05_01385 [Bacteroidetes bacterium]|nr:MAG: hypothetical protein DRJ05_01385 [Bacteroidota bacterium]